MKKILLPVLLTFMNITFSQNEFIMTWEVTDGNLEIQIPASGNTSDVYNYTIDFGDGSVQNNVNGDINHTYAVPGLYTVSISGIFPSINFYSSSLPYNAMKIKSIEQWGNIQWATMEYAFFGCSNLVINATDSPDLSMVTSMEVMFSGATNLNQPLNNWDVSNVTNMSYMFRDAISFNQPLDNWDVSNVTDMRGLFSGATSFDQPLNSWNVSNVIYMDNLFYSANAFNQPIDNWDVSNVSDMGSMFENASSFNQPLNDWTTNSLTTINRMFLGASSFNQPLDNWDVSNVSIMQNIFENAVNFDGAIDNWNVSNVQQLYEVFLGATSFNQPLNSWDVSNVTNMTSLFSGATSFNQPLDNWDVSNVIYMALMFSEATSFNQPLDDWDVSNVNAMNKMFNKATSFNQPLNNWNVSNVYSMNRMFAEAIEFNQPLDNWDTSSVTNIEFMFYQTNFNQPLNSWNVSNVQSMVGVFADATLFNQPLNNWDVSNAYSLSNLFAGAISFNQDISNWNTSNASSMSNMFNNAYSFNQDISNWNFDSLSGTYSLYYFLSFSGLSIQNYDALLNKFNSLGYYGIQMHANFLKYCDQDTVDNLTNDYNWNIIGHSLSNECNSIFGTVYYDQDLNGCDLTDYYINNLFINASNNGVNYSKLIQESNYELSVSNTSLNVSLLNLPSYFTVTPQIATVDFTTTSTEQVDFCLTANQVVGDLNITILPLDDARPGFDSNYKLIVQNVGTETLNAVTVNVVFDNSKQSFVSANPIATSTTANTLDFSIGTIQPFGSTEVEFVMQTLTPPTVNADDVLTFTATVLPDASDYTPNDNVFTLNQIVVNAYDPNDKRVLQGDEITMSQTADYLDYIIRFQNTGSANATFVRIEDNLDPELDWNTLKITSASHAYDVKITNGNEVEFFFDNINLPYEAADEPNSHGYIAYKIKPKTTVQIGDIMSGNASIYFDYNPPIITNTVSTEVIENLSTDEYSFQNALTIYPNPTNEYFKVEKSNNVNIESIKIYNISGKLVKEFTESERYNVSDLNSGFYFLRIKTVKSQTIKKLVKS